VLALELDGALLWSADFFDSTAFAAGPALYDLDGDGTLEVLYADMTTFRILDGATGAALYTDDSHESWTALETPVVGDLDGQGHAEIAVVRNEVSRHLGLSVVAYVHDPFQVGDGPDWRLSSTTWPLWGYAATNFSDDGAIPVAPTPPWSAHNSLRAGLPQVGPDDLPDLSLAITDLCVDDCAAGPAVVALQAANEGLADVPAGTAVALWADDCTGVRLVGETEAPALPAGTAAEGWAVAMPLSDLGACGLVATIDDKGHASGVVRECDELDNRATWPKPCP
jgi:hypothetical protein